MKKRILSVIAVLALAAVLAVAMVACIPSDPDKAADNLKAADYLVDVADDPVSMGVMGLMADGIEAVVSGTSDDFTEGVTIFYFEDSDTAKSFYESDFISEMKEEAEAESEELVIKRQGKIVYAGTKEAIKAAR